MPLELIGDSARGDEYALVRLVVDGERIVEADAPGLARPIDGLTLLEAAAVPGDVLATDALAAAIANALDAVPEGGHVSVSAGRELDALVVRIRDDGAGIPQDVQPRIFDPFYTTKGVGEGTGLGLDTVRRLLQRQEADITVESEPGRTEFQVRLPLATPA